MTEKLKALAKSLARTLDGTPRLRRTTLVKTRYELGLGLKELKKTRFLGEQETETYKMMLSHVDDAMGILLRESEIIEDFEGPEDLRKNHDL